MKKILSYLFLLSTAVMSRAQNPYLPLWEHLPDGEPRVLKTPTIPAACVHIS